MPKNDTIEDTSNSGPSNEIINGKIVKLTIFIFVFFIYLSSDLHKELMGTWGMVSNNELTNKAFFFNALAISLGFIIVNLLIDKSII